MLDVSQDVLQSHIANIVKKLQEGSLQVMHCNRGISLQPDVCYVCFFCLVVFLLFICGICYLLLFTYVVICCC